jgi:hypothetical protein
MNVDRARFLLLTTAISAATAVALSASGCSATTNQTDGGTVSPIPGDDAATTPTDSGTDAYSADASDGATCLTDDGIAPTCESATADATCTAQCQLYLPNYKKGVARAIADCVLALPSCEGGSTNAGVANCVQIALASACADPSAATFCQPLVAECAADGGTGALDQTECQDLAVGLSDAGRVEFTSCINEGMAGAYCIADPTSCIDAIE